MAKKIAVVGPPHSGKSVFLSGLTKCLDRGSYYLFRACPDGEGSWTWRNEAAARFRRKGRFTKEIVDWYVSSLRKADSLAPLTLVDIGGRITEENRRILCDGEVDAAIILAGDLQAVPEWKTFLEDCGVSVLATIHSDYHGQMDTVDGPILSVHYLERGQDVSSRPVINKIAAMLLDMVKNRVRPEPEMAGSGEKGEKNMKIKINELANQLGKEAVERTLPNGKTISQIVWEGSDLPEVSRLLHNISATLPEVVDIDGAAPAWLVAALVHECHPRSVRLNSPDGFVPVGVKAPEGSGSGPNLEFVVEDRGDWTWITCQQVDPSVPLSPGDLNEVVPPEVPMGAKVVLSGRMPNWLASSLAMAYHGQAKAVALFQPGTGATVAWTHSREVSLGEVIPE